MGESGVRSLHPFLEVPTLFRYLGIYGQKALVPHSSLRGFSPNDTKPLRDLKRGGVVVIIEAMFNNGTWSHG